MQKRMKKIVIPLFITLLFVAGGVFAVIFLHSRTSNTVATMDGYAITAQELSFHMNKLKPVVQNEFLTKYQAVLEKKDWSKEFAGISPLEELQIKALEESLLDKTTFIVAQKEGLIDSVEFSDLISSMKKENQSRKAAISRGEIVYGLEQFTVEEYYSHLLSALKTELKKKLSQEKGDLLYIERGDVEQYFQQNKEEWRVNATSYQVTKLDVPAAQSNKAALESKLIGLLQQNAGIEGIQKYYTETTQHEETVTQEDGAYLNSYNSNVLSNLKELNVGELTLPIETEQGLSIFRLNKIIFDEAKALEEYSSAIKQQMLDERLEEYLNNYQESLEVKINDKEMKAVVTS